MDNRCFFWLMGINFMKSCNFLLVSGHKLSSVGKTWPVNYNILKLQHCRLLVNQLSTIFVLSLKGKYSENMRSSNGDQGAMKRKC